MRRKGKMMMLAMCLATVAGCAQSQHQVSGSNQAKWARSVQESNKRIPEYIPPNILPQTHLAAARLLEKQGQIDEAIVQYRKAIALNHKLVPAYHRLGILLSAAGHHDEATASLRKAVELAPKVAVLRNDLGAELMFREHWAGAEHEFREATELKPEFARAYVNRGIALTRLGRFDEAKRVFKTILPEPDALYNLGLMYRGQKRFAEAAQTFREVLDIDPDFIAARTQLNQVADLLPPPTPSEMGGPHNPASRNNTADHADYDHSQGLRMTSRSSAPVEPFDVKVAQQRRERETQNKQAQAPHKPQQIAREHAATQHRTASSKVTTRKDTHVSRHDNASNNAHNYVNNHAQVTIDDNKASDAEKLAPMLKFFRPKAQAQIEQQRQAQAEMDNQRQMEDVSLISSPMQDISESLSSTLVELPYDSPCDTGDFSPGDDQEFEAMLDAEIRDDVPYESPWPNESFLPETMASQIVAEFWSDADIMSERCTAPVNFSIGHNHSLHEIESLVAAEEPCRDTIDENDSTLLKFAAVQRVHQKGPFERITNTINKKNTRKTAPASSESTRPDRKPESVSPKMNSHKKDDTKKNQPHKAPNRSTEKSKTSASEINLRMSQKNAANQQWHARQASYKNSPSARKNVAKSSSINDWQDCFGEPAIASAVMFRDEEIVNYTINARMTLRENERMLEELREERRCLDRSLVEREMVDASVGDDENFGAVMFGAGWQMPNDNNTRLNRRSASSDVAYVPSAPGLSSHKNMLLRANRTEPNRRSTMSSVVMPRSRRSSNGNQRQASMPTPVFQQDNEQYIQDYELQMSVPAVGYPDTTNGYDFDSAEPWSLDPEIMDAPLEVLINETNCWEDQRHSDGMSIYQYECEKNSSSAEIQPVRSISSTQFADLRKRDRVLKEEEENDDETNDRPAPRSQKRRPWFKP